MKSDFVSRMSPFMNVTHAKKDFSGTVNPYMNCLAIGVNKYS